MYSEANEHIPENNDFSAEEKIRKIFENDQDELNYLNGIIPKLKKEREALGEIGQEHSIDEDDDRVEDIFNLLSEFEQRQEELMQKIRADKPEDLGTIG